MKKNEITTNNNKLKAKQIQLLLPFSENQGTQILSKMSKDLKKCPLANVNVKTTIGYQNTKLSPQFSVKYKTKFKHQHNLVYFCKCPDFKCKDAYVGETD